MNRFLLSFCFIVIIAVSASAQCWQKVAAGGEHSLAIKPDGTLWGWGANFWGQLGNGTTTEFELTPIQVGTDNDWKEVSAGGHTSIAIKNDGTLWVWGWNGFGQLGDGTFGVDVFVQTPKKIGTDTNWKNVYSSGTYSMAIKTDGTLWAWGANSYGQLGISSSETFKPVPTQAGNATNWKMVAQGVRHAVGVKTDGTLWAMGDNTNHQLGHASVASSSAPIQIGTRTDWQIVGAGFTFSMGLTTDGKRWVWGSNDSGQLGTGSFDEVSTPLNPDPTVTWKTISIGYNYSNGIKTNGTLWSWGVKMGYVSSSENLPVQSGPQTNWHSLVAGQYHAFAFKTDGALWSWGRGDYGKRGNGSQSNAILLQNIGGGSISGAATQSFCSAATLADLDIITSVEVEWYSEPTGGSVLASNTALVNGEQYYASQVGVTCAGTGRFEVTVSVNLTPTPAPTGTASQVLCLGSTVSELVATGTGIQWYAAASGGAPLESSSILTNNTHYFASQTINGCESASRLDVTASLTVTASPSGNATQTFCSGASISLLSATGTDVKWYSTSTGGTPLPAATALANGSHYFASQTLNGCESLTRFDVTTTVNTTPLPTANTTQTFCLSGTIASLQAIGTAVKWYNAAEGGSPLANTVPLVNNAHYFVSQTLNDCESPRLDVTTMVTDVDAPTGESEQSLSTRSTVADLEVTGTSVSWYASSNDAVAGVNELPSSHQLVSGTTYFATQTIGSCESDETLTVAVLLVTGLEEDIYRLQAYPNPVKDRFMISAAKSISQVVALNNLGQPVHSQLIGMTEAEIDFSNLSTGIYCVQIHISDKVLTMKMLKQ